MNADFFIKSNHLIYTERMILGPVLRPDGLKAQRTERCFVALPRRTMHQLVSTAADIANAFRKVRGAAGAIRSGTFLGVIAEIGPRKIAEKVLLAATLTAAFQPVFSDGKEAFSRIPTNLAMPILPGRLAIKIMAGKVLRDLFRSIIDRIADPRPQKPAPF